MYNETPMRLFLYRVMTGQEEGMGAGLIRLLFQPLAWLYGALVHVRNAFFNAKILAAESLGRPVISIGNVTWGGSGKTPFVLMLAEYVQRQKHKPAILTRGYASGGSTVSDEARMLEEELPGIPVGQGADRLASGRKILSSQPVDVFILDDGFQRRQIKRDLDIVLIDSTNPFGNGQVLPAGILREPLSELKRAHIIVLTKINLLNANTEDLLRKIQSLNPQALVVQAAHLPSRVENFISREEFSLSVVQGQKVIGFAGIADPFGFENMLKGLGLDLVEFVPFLDHHEYTSNDINLLLEKARKAGCSLIMTAKDAGKLKKFENLITDVPCWILKIRMSVETQHEAFFSRINHLLDR